jgi:hypothetical protein
MMRRRIAGISLAAMLAAAVFAVAAGANPPDHFANAEDYSGVAPCAGFDNYYEGHLDISGITTFDKQGNPVEDVVHISGWERNWRSDRPQVSITAKRQFNVTFDYATHIEKDSGPIYTQTAPGQGLLFHDVGNIQFNDATGEVVAIHGPHDTFTGGQQAYCDALIAVS